MHSSPETSPTDRPWRLYRWFDRDGVLLYLGMTFDPAQRADDHRRGSWWFQWADHVKVDPIPIADPDEAAAAELAAIGAERPLFNTVGSTRDLDEISGYLIRRGIDPATVPQLDHWRAAIDREGNQWRRIVDEVTEQITSGRWPVGSRLPSVRQMTRTYAVSDSVIRRALQALSELRLVEGRERVGTIVVGTEPRRSPAEGQTLAQRVTTLEAWFDRLEETGCCTCARHSA